MHNIGKQNPKRGGCRVEPAQYSVKMGDITKYADRRSGVI